jgi:hypothetical protein
MNKTTMLKSLVLLSMVGCGSVDTPDGEPDAMEEPTDPTEPTPEIRFLGGSVRDERADQVDFSSGEPVHTHAGAPIALTEAGCTTIYKYGYLLDRAPTFGREATANPLAMRFQAPNVAPLDPTASAYRILADDGAVMKAWTTLTPDADGNFTVSLFRDEIEGLDEPGERRLDVRFRDTNGTEKVASVCWNLHALAAPLLVEAPTSSTLSGSLFSLSLPGDTPMASVINGNGNGVAKVADVRIVQQTTEPVNISVALSVPSMTYTARSVDDYVADGAGASVYPCGTDRCTTTPPADPLDITRTGSLTGVWSMYVIDEASGEVVCVGEESVPCKIPGRGEAAAPHAYRVVAGVGALEALRPPTQIVLDQVLQGFSFLGAILESRDVCTSQRVRIDASGNETYQCMTSIRYTRFMALDHAEVELTPASFTFSTITQADRMGAPLHHLATSTLSTPAMSWDSGDDDLPGPN